MSRPGSQIVILCVRKVTTVVGNKRTGSTPNHVSYQVVSKITNVLEN